MEHTGEDHILETLQRLREHFASLDSDKDREGLKLLDELEKEWHSGVPVEGHQFLLRQAEETLQQSADRTEHEDLFHRAMHSLEAALVDLETTIPAAARLMKRMVGLISQIGI